jgi:uncharacterized protein YdhG (YjbR/CyaY superfamily)
LNSTKNKFQSIDKYIESFPSDIQEILQKIRETVKKAAPDAEETISYQIPTFKFLGNLVHFAAFKNHIGFYPTSKAIEVFRQGLKSYETSKGTIRFPLNEKIPYALIARITKYRVEENLKKARKKDKQ